jgi:hypothetical protein
MTRDHDVSQLTTAELERARRDLHANLGLIAQGSPAHAPIQAHMRAIDAELAGRAGHQKADGGAAVLAGAAPMGCDPLIALSNEYGADWNVRMPGRCVADHRRVDVTLMSDSVSGLAEKLRKFTETDQGPAVNPDTRSHSQPGVMSGMKSGSNPERGRARKRLLAIDVLLEDPEGISDGLEAELYALRDRLRLIALGGA